MRISLRHINIFIITLYLLFIFPLWNSYLRPSAAVSGRFFERHIEQSRFKSREAAQLRKINLLMPVDYKELIAFLKEPVGRDPQALLQYILYYHSLAETLPAPLSADANALLGFCYIHQKNFSQAAVSLKKSIHENPAYIWAYFNLAYVHFQEGEYQKSSDLIGQVMTLNPDFSMRILATSKIYMDILREEKDVDVNAHLVQTYADAMRLLVIGQYRLRNFTEVISASRYALTNGIGPAEFFNFYAALASVSGEDRLKADTLLSSALQQKVNPLTGEDIRARFF